MLSVCCTDIAGVVKVPLRADMRHECSAQLGSSGPRECNLEDEFDDGKSMKVHYVSSQVVRHIAGSLSQWKPSGIEDRGAADSATSGACSMMTVYSAGEHHADGLVLLRELTARLSPSNSRN